ncbi:MAG: DUF5348 domain-containing protein [Lachnospiraceae bacterium]|nr:DUF5348 domain-containing protein [Lachnospiraceae bacterium]
MSEKRIGTLFYKHGIKRYDIRFGLEEYYDGLHCIEYFDGFAQSGKVLFWIFREVCL